ncbi:MAG: transglutaminase family protein [Microscillaceae bacterium]|nr:transglutaminase family protein [Microscillaceae bacterium]
MKEFFIEYLTENHYENPVNQGYFEFTIIPCESPYQTSQLIQLHYNLKGVHFFSHNKYDFETLHVRSEASFDHFRLSYKARVKKESPDFITSSQKTICEELDFMQKNSFYLQYAPFLHPTALTKLPRKHIPAELLRRDKENIGVYLERLNAQLAEILSYQSGITQADTTAEEAMERKKGVCQDFSHVMIGILRYQHIAARYVSGYLNSGENAADAHLHAWVEVYIPFVGWKGFDPTNRLMEDEHYIKIAHGKDYLDCQPIKGILKTQGENRGSYSIRVEEKIELNPQEIYQQQQ